MIGRSFLISRDEPVTLHAAAEALRAWEPSWDLVVPPRFAALYEPDGTLYGFCRGTPMTVRHNHREQSLAGCDLLIVPRELALDVEPEVDLVALRHAGAPPDHFRERFIQVWGYERFAAPACVPQLETPVAVIPAGDARYPLEYVLMSCSTTGSARRTSGAECVLLIAFEGGTRIALGREVGTPQRLASGDALLIGPGLEFTIDGEGRIGIVALFTDVSHHARRSSAASAGVLARPEFDPAGWSER